MQTGGLGYDVPAGRRDGRISLASEASTNLPPPTFTVDQLTQFFSNKGLTQDEMVTLSGNFFQPSHKIRLNPLTKIWNQLLDIIRCVYVQEHTQLAVRIAVPSATGCTISMEHRARTLL